METGVINEENLSGLLRNLSQRRRNGVLEITYPEQVVSLCFNKGKVVDVVKSTVSACAEIVTLLKQAECLPANAELQSQNYSELFRDLNNFTVIDEEFFRRVVRHYVLENLYALDLTKGAYYTFKVQMVEADKNFAPSISAGQLLLDFVALQTDADRFQATFAADKAISRGEMVGALSEEETAVFDALAVPRTLEQLRARALLSRFHLQDALLSMFERGAVIVGDAALLSSGGEATVSIADQLDGIISEVGAVAEAELDVEGEPSALESAAYRTMGPSLRVQLLAHSTRLLQSPWVPNVIMILYCMAAISLPFFVWPKMLSGF